MRRHCTFAVIAVLLTATPLFAQKQLTVLATVTDSSGGTVTSLDPADVHVQENGADATVVSVKAVQRVPKVQILVDNGIGIPSASIGDVRRGVKDLINALPPMIEITLVSTAPQPRFLQRATTDRIKLLDSVDRMAPDGGTGRFTESIEEAMERVEKDKQEDASYTIIAVGSTAGDLDLRESDVKKMFERVQRFHPTVDVVLLNNSASAQGGENQINIAQKLTQGTGGRLETLSVANRIGTLLPEIGQQVTKAVGPGTGLFRIVFTRPNGASGALGQVGFGLAGGKTITNVVLDQK